MEAAVDDASSMEGQAENQCTGRPVQGWTGSSPDDANAPTGAACGTNRRRPGDKRLASSDRRR
ncbi:MAG: hypothetical protein ACRDD1_16025 [Planctomycetia bacterium]